jgi:hypothetical protein
MLRHACGFALANAGHDTRALQAYLGHRNIQHTVRYTERREPVQRFLTGLMPEDVLEQSSYKMGRYGAGTLWCLRNSGGVFITFNNVRIARRPKDGKAWAALEPGWKVTSVGSSERPVQ